MPLGPRPSIVGPACCSGTRHAKLWDLCSTHIKSRSLPATLSCPCMKPEATASRAATSNGDAQSLIEQEENTLENLPALFHALDTHFQGARPDFEELERA